MEEKTYTTREICRGLDIPERQLIHWADKGFVTPLVDAEGLGTRRQYTAKNVEEIAIVNDLWGKVSNTTIKRVIQWLNVYENQPEEVEYMILVGEDVHPVRKDYIWFIPKVEKNDKPREMTPGGWAIKLPMDQVEIPDLSILVDAITNNELVVVLNVRMVREKAKGLIVS